MKYSSMISIADLHADAAHRLSSVLFAQVHSSLASKHNLSFSALGIELFLINTKIAQNNVDNGLNCDDTFFHLDKHAHHTACKSFIDRMIESDGVGKQ